MQVFEFATYVTNFKKHVKITCKNANVEIKKVANTCGINTDTKKSTFNGIFSNLQVSSDNRINNIKICLYRVSSIL